MELESMDTSPSSSSSQSEEPQPTKAVEIEVQKTSEIAQISGVSSGDSFPSTSTTTIQIQRTSSIKKFIFRSSKHEEPLVVLIPERTEASYGLYVWPSAQILAWFLYEHREGVTAKRILELGAGTSLPGILCALLGASQVILSDSSKLPHCLDQARKSAALNKVEEKVRVIGITWGLFTKDLVTGLRELDLVLGSDCFYDPSVFDELLCTVAWILENNPKAKFLSAYQERSSDWSIETLLSKWNLQCRHIDLTDLANRSQIDLLSLTQNHTIHLLEITLK